MRTKIIIGILLILIIIPMAYSECIGNLNRVSKIYSSLETPLVEWSCSESNEKSKAYTVSIINGTNGNGTVLGTDSGTTPSTVGEVFTTSYTILSNFTKGFINFTLQGSNLEGSENVTVSSATSNQLLITDIKTQGTFLGLSSSIDVDVSDEDGNLITGGMCNVRVQDPTIDENFVIIQEPMSDGDFDASWVLDYTQFKENKDYEVQLTCHCGTEGSSTECFSNDTDVNASVLAGSVGSTFASFTTSEWIKFLSDPLPISYSNGTFNPNQNLTAGFDRINWIRNATNNNPDNESLETFVRTFLVNEKVLRIYGEQNEGSTSVRQRGFARGNSTSTFDHLLAKDAPSGKYHITLIFDVIYKSQFQVAQYIVLTDPFNVTSIQDTLIIHNTTIRESFENDVNTSATTQSLSSLPESNFSSPFTLLTEGFDSDFCITAKNNHSDDIIVHLDSLILENPTLGSINILVDESNKKKTDLEANTTEKLCFSNFLPTDLKTHSDYRFAYEMHIGKNNERFECGEPCLFNGHSDYFYISQIEDMIDIPNFLVSPSATSLGRPGIFIMNNKNEKMYMFDDYNYTDQVTTDWGNSSSICLDKDDGSEKLCDLGVYPTSGRTIKACFEAKSYFREEVFITISDVIIDRDKEESAEILSDNVLKHGIKSTTNPDMYLSETPSRAYEGDNNLTDGRNFFCTGWMTIPSSTYGGNDWDIQMTFMLNNEIYGLPIPIDWVVESDEFPIFGKIEQQPTWGLHLFDPVHYNVPEKWFKISNTRYLFNLTIPKISSNTGKFTFGEHIPFRLTDESLPLERVLNVTVKYRNGSDIGYKTELFVQFEQIVVLIKDVNLSRNDNNFTILVDTSNLAERSTSALESTADIRILNTLNKLDYFNNERIGTPSIDETALMKFYINILKNPEYGEKYRVTYEFYARSGEGELVDSIDTEIIGLVNHSIYMRSITLNPTTETETYEVRTIVSMQSTNGIWESFFSTDIGNLTVSSVGAPTNQGAGAAGLYDVIVDVLRPRYEKSEEVVSEITIKNTGDIPDEDTILIYYLTNPIGKRFGETKEQFLEVPQGITLLRKSLNLPSDAVSGEWRFNVEYHTVVQPLITAYDSFEVVDKVPFIEKVRGGIIDITGRVNPLFIILFIIFMFLIWKEKL